MTQSRAIIKNETNKESVLTTAIEIQTELNHRLSNIIITLEIKIVIISMKIKIKNIIRIISTTTTNNIFKRSINIVNNNITYFVNLLVFIL